MSAMNRKMFVNRDARNKLAGMGGILSSSSELMGATQRFEPGGVVNAGEGLTPIATVGNRSFFLAADGRSIVDGEGRAVRDPSVLRAIMQQDQGGPAPVSTPAPEPRGFFGTIGDLMSSNDDDKREILGPPAAPEPGMMEGPPAIEGPFRNIPRFNSDSLQGAVDRAQNDGFDPAQFAGSSLETPEDPQGFFGTIGSLMTADDAAKEEILRPFINDDGTLNPAGDEGPSPEQGAFSLPMGPNLMDAPAPSTPDGAAAALQQSVLEAQEAEAPADPEVAAPAAPEVAPPAAAPPAMDIDTDQLGADIDSDPANAGATAANAVLGSAGVDTSGMGIQERTVAMRDMLDGLMGQTDAQEKEEFWMNMAMVGFGIAAGESSSAMKNIADGLLAGTAQISKGNAAKSERNDRFTLTAFGEVLADQRAQEKFDRDVTLAEIRGSGSGSIYGDRKDPLTAVYQLAQTMFAAGEFDTLTDAIAAAKIQVYGDYGITEPPGGGSGSGGGEDMVTIEQGGQRIQIPRSQLPGN